MNKKTDADLMYAIRESRAALKACLSKGDNLRASQYRQDLEEGLEEMQRRLSEISEIL